MNARELLADRLVRQKAILDALRHADSLSRVEAADLYRPGAADPTPLGRVRMDKGRQALRVVDPAALAAWVRETCPENLIVTESVNPAFVKALERVEGVWVDTATGEVSQVPGVALCDTPPRLVVTTTDAAEGWAHAALGAITAGPLAIETAKADQ